jgi:hypothetical protein
MSGYLQGVLARARGEGLLLRPLPRTYHGEPASEHDLGLRDAAPASPRRAERAPEGVGPSSAPPEPQAPRQEAARGREESPDPGQPLTRSPLAPPETRANDGDAAAAPAEPPRIVQRTEDRPVPTAPRRASEERLEHAARREPVTAPARRGPRAGSRRDGRAATEPRAALAPVRPAAALVREPPAPAAVPEPITVSIGRVEIRATLPQPVAAPSIREPRQSLDDFLRAREGGRDR